MSGDLSLLRGYALGLVRAHIESRRAAGIVPDCAPLPELIAELREDFTESLRRLCREGFLTVSTDINKNPMFFIGQTPDADA